MVSFCPGNIRSAKTAGNLSLNTLCTCLHGALHCLLHSSTEGNSALQLSCNIFSHQLGIQIWILNINDVKDGCFLCKFLNFLLQAVSSGTTLTDYDSGLCSMNIYSNAVSRSFNLYF